MTENTEICLPPFGRCDPTDGGGGGGGDGKPNENPYFVECSQTHNSRLCGNDKCWYMPFEDGDVIQYQNNTLSGQNDVFVTDLNGDNLDGFITMISDNGENGQNITIIPPEGADCFKVTNFQNDSFPPEIGGFTENCLAWEYAREPCDNKTFKIRGIYKDGEVDCFGNIYPFDNSIRLRGYLLEGKTSTITKTMFGEKVKERQVDSFWTLYIDDILPSYVHRVLAKQMIAANEIEIEFEGLTYRFETEDSYTLTSVDMQNRMFHYEDGITLKLTCIVKGKC